MIKEEIERLAKSYSERRFEKPSDAHWIHVKTTAYYGYLNGYTDALAEAARLSADLEDYKIVMKDMEAQLMECRKKYADLETAKKGLQEIAGGVVKSLTRPHLCRIARETLKQLER